MTIAMYKGINEIWERIERNYVFMPEKHEALNMAKMYTAQIGEMQSLESIRCLNDALFMFQDPHLQYFPGFKFSLRYSLPIVSYSNEYYFIKESGSHKVKSINGNPISQIHNSVESAHVQHKCEHILNGFRFQTDSTIEIATIDGLHESFTFPTIHEHSPTENKIALEPDKVKDLLISSYFDAECAYIRLNTLDYPQIVQWLYDILVSIGTRKSLVLDLRLNKGGSIENAEAILGMLILRDTTILYKRKRIANSEEITEPEPALVKQHASPVQFSRIYVLQSVYTGSSAEYYLANGLRLGANAIIIGDTGATINNEAQQTTFHDGSKISITNTMYCTENGTPYCSNGITPDIYYHWSLSELLGLSVADPAAILELVLQLVERE